MRRVVQFSTGNVGVHSLQAIIGRPDMELVGVHAASPNKIGRDASELCGLDQPTGVIATDDIDALIASKPDCVVYTAQGETRPMEALEQMSKFLAAGINVAATSMVWLVTPRQADDWLRVPLEQACETGNASLYVNGIDPGYSGDTEVHSALSLVTRAKSITVQEIFDYGNYDDYEFTGKSMGFGMTADDDDADAVPARRHHDVVGWSGPQSRRAARRGTRRGSSTHRAVVHRSSGSNARWRRWSPARWPRPGSRSRVSAMEFR